MFVYKSIAATCSFRKFVFSELRSLKRRDILKTFSTSTQRHLEVDEFLPIFSKILDSTTYTNEPDLKEKFQNEVFKNLDYMSRSRIRLFEMTRRLINENKESSVEPKSSNILLLCMEIMQIGSELFNDVLVGNENKLSLLIRTDFDQSNRLFLSCMMENAANTILMKHFANHKNFPAINRRFSEMKTKKLMGILLDQSLKSVDDFNEEKFEKFVYNGETYPNIETPISLAILLENQNVSNIQSYKIFHELGKMILAQKNFLDLQAGELGYDIEEGSFTWFIMRALKKSSSTQKNILRNNYGKSGRENMEKVLQVYDDLKLISEYHNCQKENLNNISEILASTSEVIHPVFSEIVQYILKEKNLYKL